MNQNLLYKFARVTHKYIGFFVLGLSIVYAFTGLLLLPAPELGPFKELFMVEERLERNLPPNLERKGLAKELDRLITDELDIKNKKQVVLKEKQDGRIEFSKGVPHGSYERETGFTVVIRKSPYPIVRKMRKFHTDPVKPAAKIAAISYCILLFYLAVSSLFMYKFKTAHFVKGTLAALAGIAVMLAIICYM